jgi:hypothetical protein
MTARRLTKQVVDELGPRDTDYVVWCGKLPGFGCRVRTTGHKSFIAMYRAGGRNATPRKVTIGVYGKLTVEQAREEAGKILAKAELGEDVALQRARVRAERPSRNCATSTCARALTTRNLRRSRAT